MVSGPDLNNFYTLDCINSYTDGYGQTTRWTDRYFVEAAWVRPDDPTITPGVRMADVQPAPQSGPPPPAPVTGNAPMRAPAGAFRAGDIVLASPWQITRDYRRCAVLAGPDMNNFYDLDCVNAYTDGYGVKTYWADRYRIEAAWVRPDDPAFQPDMQVAAARR